MSLYLENIERGAGASTLAIILAKLNNAAIVVPAAKEMHKQHYINIIIEKKMDFPKDNLIVYTLGQLDNIDKKIPLIFDDCDINPMELEEEGFNVFAVLKHKEPKSIYDRVAKGDTYYYIDNSGAVKEATEENNYKDDMRYNFGNYYNSFFDTRKEMRAKKLIQNIKRWQAQNDIKGLKSQATKYYINFKYNETINKYHPVSGDSSCYCCWYPYFAGILFSTAKVCKQCIETFKDELDWYVNEYVKCA